VNPALFFGAFVVIAGQKVPYNTNYDRRELVDLPQPSKFECYREPVSIDKDRGLIRFTCEDKRDKGVTTFGVACAPGERHEAIMIIDVSPTEKVMPAMFVVACENKGTEI